MRFQGFLTAFKLLQKFNLKFNINLLASSTISLKFHINFLYEPRCEKTGLRGFRPGPTQTGLHSHRRLLDA